jgi:hypothetical protein
VSTQEPGRPAATGLTVLPRTEELPRVAGGGYDEERVRAAVDSFRRHTAHDASPSPPESAEPVAEEPGEGEPEGEGERSDRE